MSRSIAIQLAILTSLGVSASPTVNAELLTLTTSAPDLNYIQHMGDSFYRPAGDFGIFWDFCQPNNCYGYDTPGVERQRSFYSSGSLTDSLLSAEGTVTYNNYPVDLYTRTFPASNLNSGIGTYIYDWSIDPSFFDNFQSGKAYGFQMTDAYSDYAFRHWMGTTTYNYAGTMDLISAPAGYDVRVETVMEIIFSSSWINAEGRPVHYSEPIYSNVFDSSFTESITLSRNLDGFPMVESDMGGYNIMVTNRFTFVEAASAVPVPAAAWLFGSGLIGLIGIARRKAA